MAGADAIVTLNVTDFTGQVLTQGGVRVVTPEERVTGLLDDLPDRVATAVAEMAAPKRKVPMTIADVLDAPNRPPDVVGVITRLHPSPRARVIGSRRHGAAVCRSLARRNSRRACCGDRM